MDVVIVGAGVAGSALAASLGRLGFSVALVDRSAHIPEVIAGELLQPGGAEALMSLGLGDALQEIDAQPVCGFAVVQGEQGQALAYPKASKATRETRGYSFHHHRFVGRLREIAKEDPNVRFCLGHVSELLKEEGRVSGLRYRDLEGEEKEIHAALVVAADGRGSKLRAHLSEGAQPEQVSYSIGVLLKDVALPFPQHGHVFLTQPAPTLAYQTSSQTTRLLIDYPGSLPKQRGGEMASYLLHDLLPQLPSALHRPLREAIAADAIMTMQNIQMKPPTPTLAGGVLIGDAYNMRHPMTGSGMTVALNDVRQLTELLSTCDPHDAKALDSAIASFYRRREALAATLDMLAGALYEIFRAKDESHALMRDAVLHYWKLGGIMVSGPMSLLSGMAPNPLLLLTHFFGVALVEAGQRLWDASRQPQRAIDHLFDITRLLFGACAIISPHLQRALRMLQAPRPLQIHSPA
jgi:squalene monooxygenase